MGSAPTSALFRASCALKSKVAYVWPRGGVLLAEFKSSTAQNDLASKDYNPSLYPEEHHLQASVRLNFQESKNHPNSASILSSVLARTLVGPI